MDEKTPLSDVFFGKSNEDKNNHLSTSKDSKQTIPKHEIRKPEEFDEGRAILGQIITTEMETTGGTDLDWVIEHRGGFLIFEFKKFSMESHSISIPLAQMLVYLRLGEQLKRSHVFFIGYYKNTDFKMTSEPLWFFELSDWNDKQNPIKYSLVEFPISKGRVQKKYVIKRENMKQIDIETLQKNMDKAWKEFES